MVDEIDVANDYANKIEEKNIAAIRAAAAQIPEGYQGECESCGLESKRLVNDMCALCREMRF